MQQILVYSQTPISIYRYKYGFNGIHFDEYKHDINSDRLFYSEELREIIKEPLIDYLKEAEEHFNEKILYGYDREVV